MANQEVGGWESDIGGRATRVLLVIDMVESVSLMEAHEDDVIARWRGYVVKVRSEVLPRHRGRLVKSLGDGLLLEFQDAVSAVHAAVDLQQGIGPFNDGYPPERAIHLRAGAHIADVVIDELDVYGSGVNLAARLSTLAGPGETVISAELRDRIVVGYDADVVDLGDCELKGIAQPVRAFRLGGEPPKHVGRAGNLQSGRTAVAVLPLTAAGDSGDVRAAGFWLADSVIQLLSSTRLWRVISRLSTHALVGREAGPQDIAEALGVSYIVCGSCQVIGGKLFVSYELVDVQDSSVLTAGRLAGSIEALAEPDEPLSTAIASDVCRHLLEAELARSDSRPLPTLRSYSLLLGGVALMHRMSQRDVVRARDMLEHLRDRHPHSPEPRAWLAKWHVVNIVQGWSSDAKLYARRGHDLLRRALDVDPKHSLALSIDGLIAVLLEGDLERAQARYDAALAANPNEALAWLFQSALHAYHDRGDEAIAASSTAIALSPLDPIRYFFDSFHAHALLAAGRLDDSIQRAHLSLRNNGSHVPTLRTLAIAQSLAGEGDGARATVLRLRAMQPAYTVSTFRDSYPGRHSPRALLYAEALADAGLPDR